MSSPFIEVCIPYEPCKKLGFAYNRVMKKVEDWVLLLDHDLVICNPNWYEMCLKAINEVGHQAGWISAVTNRTANGIQKSAEAPESNDLLQHYNFAKQVYEKHGTTLIDITETDGWEFTGFFILTHKSAWESVKGFTNYFHVDGDYAKALKEKGYKFYIMPGLYFYHLEIAKVKIWNYAKWKDFGAEYRIL